MDPKIKQLDSVGVPYNPNSIKDEDYTDNDFDGPEFYDSDFGDLNED